MLGVVGCSLGLLGLSGFGGFALLALALALLGLCDLPLAMNGSGGIMARYWSARFGCGKVRVRPSSPSARQAVVKSATLSR